MILDERVTTRRWTVEALLAMAWAGLFVPWGIMAYKMIGHSYSSKRPP